MLLSIAASTLEKDALAMRLALWMKVSMTAPQLPKPKWSYKKPQYNAFSTLLYAIKNRKWRRYMTYQVSHKFPLNNGIVSQSTFILCKTKKHHTQQLLFSWQEGVAESVPPTTNFVLPKKLWLRPQTNEAFVYVISSVCWQLYRNSGCDLTTSESILVQRCFIEQHIL